VTAVPLALAMGTLAYLVATRVLPVAPGTIPTHLTAAPGISEGLLGQSRWSPMVGGLVIGSMQLVLTLGAAKNLGASTSFQYVAALLDPYSAQAPSCRKDFDAALWQVLFVAAATAGSALGAWSGGTWYPAEVKGAIPAWQLFFGGFVLLFGSRLASGCTSGHGITGVGHQSIHSLVGTACMFAGAILTKRFLFP
jgi:uncharacterized membrane protein YedE/YeeE